MRLWNEATHDSTFRTTRQLTAIVVHSCAYWIHFSIPDRKHQISLIIWPPNWRQLWISRHFKHTEELFRINYEITHGSIPARDYQSCRQHQAFDEKTLITKTPVRKKSHTR